MENYMVNSKSISKVNVCETGVIAIFPDILSLWYFLKEMLTFAGVKEALTSPHA